MDRPTIADLARAAGVSVSTIDRVLNGRDPVRRATAEQVLSAAERIGFHAVGAIRHRLGTDRPERTLGFLLQQGSRSFYRDLGHALAAATGACVAIRGRSRVEFMDDLTPEAVADRLTRLAKIADAIAIVAADHPRLTQAIGQVGERGVPVFALISDLTAPGRAGYIGLDNWKLGRTAAWAIANICKQPGTVGIFVGSHRYLCQDVCEMSFRSYFREHAPEFHLLEPRTSLEETRYAYENTLDLMRRNPDLVGLFVAGGGIGGVMRALRDQGPEAFRRIVTIGLELTGSTRSGLIDGVLKLVLAPPLERLATAAVTAMVQATQAGRREPAPPAPLAFDVVTAENL